MKKTALLNDRISAAVAAMGHTEMLAIGDCGLPIPEETQRIDIALRKGTPSLPETLETVLEELCAERAIVAGELRDAAPDMLETMRRLLPGVPIDFVPHEQFKQLLREAKCVVRTGECTSFANILLVSGVTF